MCICHNGLNLMSCNYPSICPQRDPHLLGRPRSRQLLSFLPHTRLFLVLSTQAQAQSRTEADVVTMTRHPVQGQAYLAHTQSMQDRVSVGWTQDLVDTGSGGQRTHSMRESQLTKCGKHNENRGKFPHASAAADTGIFLHERAGYKIQHVFEQFRRGKT